MWDKILYLMEEIETFDKLNRPHSSYKVHKVYANKKSIKRSEFYQAYAAGYKPEKCFEVKTVEFDEDKYTHAKYEGTMYRILRSYEIDSEITEIVLTGFANKHDK